MVDVGAKQVSDRRAVARAVVRMSADTLDAVRRGDAPKGDVIGTARIAGIQAAKRTAELVPLCHPLPLSFVDVGADGYTPPGLPAAAEMRRGRMTGVTRAARNAAIAAGEHLPLYAIRLPARVPGCGDAGLECGIGKNGACTGTCPEGGTCRYWPAPLPDPEAAPVCGCFPPP